MARFQDIPVFTPNPTYCVDVSLSYLPQFYSEMILENHLNVCPEFQRGYVWTTEQKIRYVEFFLRGGYSGRDIYCNCPGWKSGGIKSHVLVDGKQRLDALFGFLNSEFPVFGGSFNKDFEDRPNRLHCGLRWHINDLKTYDEVLKWYVDLNSGGTVHSPNEISHVQGLIGKCEYKDPSIEELKQLANLDRQIFGK